MIKKLKDRAPFERLVIQQRLEAMRAGTMATPPLRCGWCRSASVLAERPRDHQLTCVSCGRLTELEAAKISRSQEIIAVATEGVGSDY